ncbi:MAG TPA: ABC transporter ATP-binding protein [Candidatus Cybelea sp.]|jgi:iron complex transport system ATP-binding protein|nr:ABC transporter ATP-binding protein [Candidatus Cybelea sp.]
MIELHGVELAVGGRSLLGEIDATVAPGEFVALLGRNGAGKTTLLRAIAGLHRAASGAILIDGRRSDVLAPLERAKRIAFVTGDEVFLEALLVRDVVAIGRFAHHRWWQWNAGEEDAGAIARALEAVRLEGLAHRLFSTLSAGERQRVWIALGLAQDTPILLLDEPTSHLDVAVAHEILSLLRRLAHAGKSVICALHDVNEAVAYADRVALLGSGRLLGTPAPQELNDGALLEETYGIPFTRRGALLPLLDRPHV